MDCIFRINKLDVKGLGFEKGSGFFKVKVPPESDLGLAVRGVEFCELEMLREERKGFSHSSRLPSKMPFTS